MTRMLIVAPEVLMTPELQGRIMDWLGQVIAEPAALEVDFTSLEEPLAEAVDTCQPDLVVVLTGQPDSIPDLDSRLADITQKLAVPFEVRYFRSESIQDLVRTPHVSGSAGYPEHPHLIRLAANGQVH